MAMDAQPGQPVPQQSPMKMNPKEFVEKKKELCRTMREVAEEALGTSKEPGLAKKCEELYSQTQESEDARALDVPAQLARVRNLAVELKDLEAEARQWKVQDLLEKESGVQDMVVKVEESKHELKMCVDVLSDLKQRQEKQKRKEQASNRYKLGKHVARLKTAGFGQQLAGLIGGIFIDLASSTSDRPPCASKTVDESQLNPKELTEEVMMKNAYFLSKSALPEGAPVLQVLDNYLAQLSDKVTARSSAALASIIERRSQGNLVYLPLKEEEVAKLGKFTWDPLPQNDEVEACLLVPWIVGMASHACRTGPSMIPFMGIGCLVCAVSAPVILITVDVELIKNSGAKDTSATTLILEEGTRLEAAEWAVLKSGAFAWVPPGKALWLTTSADDGATALVIPFFSKGRFAACAGDNAEFVVSSISAYLDKQGERKPFVALAPSFKEWSPSH